MCFDNCYKFLHYALCLTNAFDVCFDLKTMKQERYSCKTKYVTQALPMRLGKPFVA